MLNRVKETLKLLLKQDGYQRKILELLFKEFNQYLDDKEPFRSYRTAGGSGFSWLQIRANETKFSPIANVA